MNFSKMRVSEPISEVVQLAPSTIRVKAKHDKSKDVVIGSRKRSVSMDDCAHKTAVMTSNHFLGAKCPRCGRQGHFTNFNPGDVAWMEGLDEFGNRANR